MRKIIVDIGVQNNMPTWYWTRGLHDAQVLEKKYINGYGQRNNLAFNNCLELVIDAKQAMFDTDVTAIRFYNFKELTSELNIVDAWWISDNLSYTDGKYVLEISFRSANHISKYSIRFKHCEVIHK